MTKKKKAKKLVVVVCSNCGNKLTASPGVAKYALEGKGVCVKCGGTFVAREGNK